MFLAFTPLTDVGLWARSSGLEIVLVVVGAILLARLTSRFGAWITSRIGADPRDVDAVVRSETEKHRHSVAQVLTWVAVVLIYTVAAILVIQRLGVPLTGLVAPATVIGVALGFGAQRIVQDILAGFFIITERQYGFGDVIRISATGTTSPVLGTVEDITLRITRIRSTNGEVIITPNGQIAQVTNLSRDWARAVIDVPVPATADVGHVSDVLRDVGEQAFADETLRDLLLDEPSVMGVESLAVDTFNIRMVARTLPGKQFDVGRELRSRVAIAFRREGINVPAALDVAQPSGTT